MGRRQRDRCAAVSWLPRHFGARRSDRRTDHGRARLRRDRRVVRRAALARVARGTTKLREQADRQRACGTVRDRGRRARLIADPGRGAALQTDRRVTLEPMALRHPGWKALAEAVTPGARVTRLRRLAGAGMTDAYDVTLDRAPRRVVVKLYRDGDGTAPFEWSCLGFAPRV